MHNLLAHQSQVNVTVQVVGLSNVAVSLYPGALVGVVLGWLVFMSICWIPTAAEAAQSEMLSTTPRPEVYGEAS